ncbi:unnamed protein product, partial [Discosporangium mesarthrocarpum]
RQISRFIEARRNVPSILFLPDAQQWCEGEDGVISHQMRTLLINLIQELPDHQPILLLSTWIDSRPGERGGGPSDEDRRSNLLHCLLGGRANPATVGSVSAKAHAPAPAR